MSGPSITSFEQNIVAEMMQGGWDSYEYVEKFESEFAEWHGRKYCLMTPCCTHAIHLLLLALGVKENDEIIVPECTWTATAAPITYEKAIPVFADVSPQTWCLEPENLENRITKKTKAIVAVDLYGNIPQMEILQSIADKACIPLIEDAAEALGSTYKGIKAGSFGIGSVHSFHRTKTITTGEGGALLIDDDDLYDRAKFLRDHGRSSSNPYFTLKASPKYMPSNLQGALGWAQLQRIDELIERKRYFFHQYKEKLKSIKQLQFNLENKDLKNGAWATSIIFPKHLGLNKTQIIDELSKLDIPARPFFYPLSLLPAYSDYKTGSSIINPNAYEMSERGITLPAHYNLSDKQISYICKGLIKVVNGY